MYTFSNQAGILRQLAEADADLLLAHLKRLPSHDRRLRFGMTLTDTSLERYIRRINWERDRIVGYLLGDTLYGAAECRPYSNHPELAELAFSVDPAIRGKGLGTTLFAYALQQAKEIGIKQIRICTLNENIPMQRLARKFGVPLCSQGDGYMAGSVAKDQTTQIGSLCIA